MDIWLGFLDGGAASGSSALSKWLTSGTSSNLVFNLA